MNHPFFKLTKNILNYSLLLLFFALLTGACHSAPEKGESADVASYEEALEVEQAAPMAKSANGNQSAAQQPEGKQPVEEVTTEKKIIKEGRMDIEVQNISQAKQKVDSLVKHFGGYYGNETFHNNDYQASFNLVIRIPVQHYDAFVAGVSRGTGIILSKNINARDVTDQFVDLETRLTNKRTYLNRYKELVKKAKTIKEILQIEEKIRVLEEEIESAEGRLRYLSSQVKYSTLNLSLIHKNEYEYKPKDRNSFTERFKESVASGWYGFVDVMLFLLRIWPFLIIFGAVFYLMRKLKKNKGAN